MLTNFLLYAVIAGSGPLTLQADLYQDHVCAGSPILVRVKGKNTSGKDLTAELDQFGPWITVRIEGSDQPVALNNLSETNRNPKLGLARALDDISFYPCLISTYRPFEDVLAVQVPRSLRAGNYRVVVNYRTKYVFGFGSPSDPGGAIAEGRIEVPLSVTEYNEQSLRELAQTYADRIRDHRWTPWTQDYSDHPTPRLVTDGGEDALMEVPAGDALFSMDPQIASTVWKTEACKPCVVDFLGRQKELPPNIETFRSLASRHEPEAVEALNLLYKRALHLRFNWDKTRTKFLDAYQRLVKDSNSEVSKRAKDGLEFFRANP